MSAQFTRNALAVQPFFPHRPKAFLRFTPEPLSLYPQRMARRVVAAEFNAAVDRAGRQRRTGAGVKRAGTARTIPFFQRYIAYFRDRRAGRLLRDAVQRGGKTGYETH